MLPGRVHRTYKANWTKLGNTARDHSTDLPEAVYGNQSLQQGPPMVPPAQQSFQNQDGTTPLQTLQPARGSSHILLCKLPRHLLPLCAFLLHKAVEKLRLEETSRGHLIHLPLFCLLASSYFFLHACTQVQVRHTRGATLNWLGKGRRRGARTKSPLENAFHVVAEWQWVSLPRYIRYGSASEQDLRFGIQKFTKGLSNRNRLTFLWKMGWCQVVTVSVKS